jgi:hypothetical protein
MSPAKPLLHVAATLLAVLGLAGSVYLAWTGLVAGAFEELTGQARLLQETARRERDLEALIRLVHVRGEGKDQVAREVAAGQLSLVEGAARFRALCQDSPGFTLKMLRFSFPGNSEEESYCRALIDRAQRILADHPAQAQAAAWRLEAELQKLLRKGTPRNKLPRLVL